MVRARRSGAIQRHGMNKILSDDIFREMLLQAEPLLVKGCDEFALKDRFRNLSMEAIDYFLRRAVARGIIRRDGFGTLIIQDHGKR